LEEARDKVRWGKERRSLALSEKEKQNTAYHEAGHALLLELLPHTEPLHKVTIIPRGPSLGSTMWLPQEDKYTNRKNELIAGLAVGMGGRVAEEIVFGEVSTGAHNDFQRATGIARKMVTEYGMSDKLGPLQFGQAQGGQVFLGRDINNDQNYSDAIAYEIDLEMQRIIKESYARCKEILTENREKLNLIATTLLEVETLDADQIKYLMENGRLPEKTAGNGPTIKADDVKVNINKKQEDEKLDLSKPESTDANPADDKPII
jgi:cell division protease FtsH